MNPLFNNKTFFVIRDPDYFEVNDIISLIKENGGIVSEDVSKEVNYVITSTKYNNSHDPFFLRMAYMLGIPAISTNFLEYSIKKGSLAENEKEFAITYNYSFHKNIYSM
ncbi:hypothetical protein DICPUDRAFT_77549 [Dictyostelium purpureum]|uniref:BRCT domain-containing protein n=1 Tax=Dictyostelium purpureum TaxID=5786 RepID=F0ZGY2_DICPU|nr:uncharacterized protein DICPUDRAFT_77549 [Dictyostelium purpureum]EGC36813.1 hypothetical protein DICPUDRAFT_77549 [Dictyostelium purpureum]|eukprot:XP_003286684.1 hypothetical protein DICPUDRAFT_77549 [Dictyostelium purpureum]